MTGYLTVGLLSAFVRNLGSRETADWKQGEDVALGDIRLRTSILPRLPGDAETSPRYIFTAKRPTAR